MSIVFPNRVFGQEKEAVTSAALIADIDVKPDSREQIIKAFLKTYNSPLAKNAHTFISTADDNRIDYRLLVAISGVESTFGRELPFESHNAWGWGIYGDNMITFTSYDEAITVISTELRQKYINKWKADDVYKMGRLYASSPTWAQRVDYFMTKIEEFALNNPDVALSISL